MLSCFHLGYFVMHSASEIISICDGLVCSGSLLIENLDKDFHRADENWSQGFNLLQMKTQVLSLLRVEEVDPSGVHVLADLGEAGTEVLDELDEVLHSLDDLGDGEVVQHLLAVPANLPHLGSVKGKQHVCGALEIFPS